MGFSLDEYGANKKKKQSGFSLDEYAKEKKAKQREEDNWYASSFSDWSKGVTDYFAKWDEDYKARNANYHTQSDSADYLKQNEADRSRYAAEASKYADYISRNKNRIADAESALSWLKNIQTGLTTQGEYLKKEADYWNQFPDEKAYLAEQEIANLTTDRSFEDISADINKGYSRTNDNQYTQRMAEIISEYENAEDFEDVTGYNFQTKRFSGTSPEEARARGYTVDPKQIELERDRQYVFGTNPEAYGKLDVASADEEIYTQLASIYYYLKKKEERGEVEQGTADSFADRAASAYTTDRGTYMRKLYKEREVALSNYESSIMSNKDFDDNKDYRPDVRAGAEHSYVNGYTVAGTTGQAHPDDVTYSYLEYATDSERDVINYLANTGRQDDLDRYVSFLKPVLTEKQASANNAYIREETNKHPITTSLLSVVLGPAKIFSLAANAADSIQGKTIDSNNPWNTFSDMPSEIRSEVSLNIAKSIEENGFLGGGEGVQETGAMLYQTGMSMLDFLYNTLITGGFSGGLGTISIGSKAINVSKELALGIMGTGAATDALINAKKKGMSDSQAWTIGIISGFAEYITEKVSIENLLNPDLLRENKLLYFLKNTLAETTEEVAADLINTFADVLVAQDASDWMNDIQNYMRQGKSYTEAFGLAVGEKAKEIGMSGLGGALSGATMAGGGILINKAGNYAKGAEVLRGDFGTQYSDLIEQGLEYGKDTAAYKIASELNRDGSMKRSRTKTGELVTALEYERASEQEGEMLLRQAAEELAYKGRIKRSTAKELLKNTYAREELDLTKTNSQDAETAVKNYTDAMRKAGESILREEAYKQMGYKKEDLGSGIKAYNPGSLSGGLYVPESLKMTDEEAYEKYRTARESYVRKQKEDSVAKQSKPFNEIVESLSDTEKTYVQNKLGSLDPDEAEGFKSILGKRISEDKGIKVDLDAYALEYLELYYAALNDPNVDIDTIKTTVDVMNAKEKMVAVAAGRKNATEEGRNDGEGNNGVRRGGERTDGEDTEVGTRGMAEERKRAEALRGSGEAEGRYADTEIQDLPKTGKEVSAVNFGIKDGTDERKVRLYTGVLTTAMKNAKEIAKKHGLKVVFFYGNNLSVEGSTVRGLIKSDGTVYVRVDHSQFTAEDLMKHESFHAIINSESRSNSRKKAIDRMWDTLRSTVGGNEKEGNAAELLKAYARAYHKDLSSEEDIYYLKEEILADMYAGMNVFPKTRLDIYSKWADNVVDLAQIFRDIVSQDQDLKRSANRQRGEPGEENTEIRFSSEISDNKEPSIRDQIRAAQSLLDKMDPVINLESDIKNGESYARYLSRIASSFKTVDRQGFGRIDISEDRLRNGLNYSLTRDEVIAFKAIPNVLKKGIEIGQHENHKRRSYKTITFAAPVEIDGVRMNLAVVVKQTRGNIYKVHKALLANKDAQKKQNRLKAYEGVDENISLVVANGSAETYIAQENKDSQAESFKMSSEIEETDRFIAWHNMNEDAYEAGNEEDRLEKANSVPEARFSSEFEEVRDRVQKDITLQYEKTVDDILNNGIKVDEPVLMGYTPDLLREIGTPDLPVEILGGHIYSIAKTEAEAKQENRYESDVHYHGEGGSVVKDLYERIRDPLLIIASKDTAAEPNRDRESIVLIVDLGTQKATHLAAIKISSEEIIGSLNYDVNLYASYYEGKIESLIREAKAREKTGEIGIYYIKNSAASSLGTGVQFPTRRPASSARGIILHEIPEKVNRKVSKQTETLQFARWFGDWQNDPDHSSKIVNDDGSPKVMYHGSPAVFDFFDIKKAKYSGLYGKGFYFTDSESTAKIYGNVYPVYLNARKPLSPGQTTVTTGQIRRFLEAVSENEDYSIENYGTDNIRKIIDTISSRDAFDVIQDINATAIGDMVEAVKLFNKVNGTRFDAIQTGSETVVFDSNQIKSATDNVGLYGKDTNNIYFSKDFSPFAGEPSTLTEAREMLKKIEKEKEKYRKEAEYYKGQMKTTVAHLDPKSAESWAKRIIKEYGSDVEKDTVSAAFKEAGRLYIEENGKTAANELEMKIRDALQPAAEEIIRHAKVEAYDQNEENYTLLRQILKDGVRISEQDRSNIADFNLWRKANYGYVTITDQGTPMDTLWSELQSEFGKDFFPDEITSPSEQLERAVEVLKDMRTMYVNPFQSFGMADALAMVTDDLMTQLYSGMIRKAEPTYADKMEARLAEERQKTADLIAKAVEDNQKKNDRVIEELKKEYKENAKKMVRVQRIQNMSERERISQNEKLRRIIKRMRNRKLSAVNRARIEEIVGYLDTMFIRMTGERLQDLQALDDYLRDNPDIIVPDRIKREVASIRKKHIGELTQEEVAKLTEALLSIETEIMNENKQIDAEDKRETFRQAFSVMNDIRNTRGTHPGFIRELHSALVLNTLSPERFVRTITGYVEGDPLQNAFYDLTKGETKMIDHQMKAYGLFDKWTNDKALMKKWQGRHADVVTINGQGRNGSYIDVEITPAMRISLYMHSLNDDNMRHIQYGGVKIPDMKLYKAGKFADAYSAGVTIKLTRADIRKIARGMSNEELAFVHAAQDYFQGMSKDSINEVAEKLLGYDIAGEENYFPIYTDSNFIKTNFDGMKFDGTIEGMGFLKERINSVLPIYLQDATKVMKRSIDSTARYVGLAIPVRNVNKLLGVSSGEFIEQGRYQGDITIYAANDSILASIDAKYGKPGIEYVRQLMRNIQTGSHEMTPYEQLFRRLRSNYAGAVLTLNAGVAMKQAASYPTAAAVLGAKPLLRAMKYLARNTIDMELVAKYTPTLWYRSRGFSTQEIGDLTSRGIKLPSRLNWIQWVDIKTTAALWKASEFYVQDHNPELKKGTEEYYDEVGKIYNKVIWDTQPNYTTMQRPGNLRSDNFLVQTLMMFKTQPFQNFNILYDAVGNFKAKRNEYFAAKNSDDAEALKKAEANYREAGKNVRRAIGSQVISLIVFAGMTALWSFLQGKKDKYKDKDGDENVLTWLAGIGKDALGGAAGMIPFGSDVWDMMSSLIFKDRYYGYSSVSESALKDLLDTIQSTASAITEGKMTPAKWKKLIKNTAQALGIPAKNVANLINGILQWFGVDAGL